LEVDREKRVRRSRVLGRLCNTKLCLKCHVLRDVGISGICKICLDGSGNESSEKVCKDGLMHRYLDDKCIECGKVHSLQQGLVSSRLEDSPVESSTRKGMCKICGKVKSLDDCMGIDDDTFCSIECFNIRMQYLSSISDVIRRVHRMDDN